MVRLSAIGMALATLSLVLPESAPAQSVTWNALNPGTPFPQRASTSSVYDPVSSAIIVFGGFDSVGYSSETWAFSGGTWSLLNPATSPSARAASTMAFDVVKKTVVLFGGFDGTNYLGDTWIFDGATTSWTQATPTVSPPPVTGGMAFTDPNGHAAIYGGYDGKFYQLGTYRWTGSNWRKLSPAHSPSARSSGIVSFDPVRNDVVLFGGLGSVNPDNTWIWDGSDWTQQNLLVQPSLRYYSHAAFEPHLGAVVVFGGGSGGVDLNDTWEWDGAHWIQLKPAQSPPVRESFAMAFDTAADRLIIAGGNDSASILSDTWEFVDQGQFVDLGPGIGGALGAPTLSGNGDLSIGSPAGFTLAIGNAQPSSPLLLLVGSTAAAIPFKDGTLYPFPIQLLVPLFTDGGGDASLSASIPVGIPSGTDIVLQGWLLDATAPKGASGTNGLEAIVP